MIFAEKGFPIILRPFKGILGLKWGVEYVQSQNTRNANFAWSPTPLKRLIYENHVPNSHTVSHGFY